MLYILEIFHNCYQLILNYNNKGTICFIFLPVNVSDESFISVTIPFLFSGIFINTRGNSKLFIYQNHTFRFMYKKAYGSQLWYCWYFFSRCCPAKLRINNAGKVTESIGRHNHDPPTCWMTPDGKTYSLPPLPDKSNTPNNV